MKAQKRRALGCALTLAFVFIAVAVFSLSSSALTPTAKISDSFKQSKYYENLTDIRLTRDARTNVIMVATSQLGYHEGNGTHDFDGMNQNGTQNYVEYNYLYGKVDGDGDGRAEYGYAWCAAFVSWCMRQADVPTSTVKSYVSCTNWITWFKEHSEYKTRQSGYLPSPADVIFFKSAGVTRASDHVGIVLYVEDGRVYTVEGNSSDKVTLRSYSLSDSYIVGYGIPDYEEDAAQRTDFSVKSRGTYIINTSALNVRSAPSSSEGSIIGRLELGDTVKVTELSDNGWGKIIYGGRIGWISTEYASLVSKNQTVLLSFKDTSGIIPEYGQRYEVGETVTILPIQADVAGYELVGWSKDADSTKATYRTGDRIRLEEDLSLYAVWRPLTFTISFYDHDGRLIEEGVYRYSETIRFPSEPPVREPDEKFAFIFKGWDNSSTVALKDDKYYAVYDIIPLGETESTTETDTSDKPTVTEPDTGGDSQPVPNEGCYGTVSGIAPLLLLVLAPIPYLARKRKR